jgi:hypothetical protein
MNSRLMPGGQLHVARRTRERAPAHLALAVLLVAVLAVGWGQREAWNGTQAPTAVSAPVPAPTGATIAGSAVPAPPPSFTAATARTRGGLHVFLTTATTDRASAASLFGYYLQAMPAAGWTLLGKGDPAKTGDWTQRWQRGADAALLTLTTRPTDSFTVELCPPDPYC